MIDLPQASADLNRFLDDASGHCGHAERAVAPSNLGELEAIVNYCRSERIPLTISGAGTGLTGSRVPEGGWVISMEKFRRLDIDPGVACCGPGVLLSELAQATAAQHQFLGPNPTEYSAAIGGAVSTNAGGARSFRYGAMRQQVLSLTATFMSGETVRFERGQKVDFPYQPIRVPKTTKNAAGYFLRPDMDWIDLLAGSEGTLAVISEVSLRLQPAPGAILSGVVFFDHCQDAADAVEIWRSIPELRLLEFMDEAALQFLRPHYSDIPAASTAALLIEQNLTSEDDNEVDEWSNRLQQSGADQIASWFGFRASDHDRFREFRHLLPVLVVEKARRNGFPKYGTDFAVPIEKGRETYQYYQQECARLLPGHFTIFGHAGDANNHINLLPDHPTGAHAAEEIIQQLASYVIEQGGTIAAEHGIGKNKRHLLELMYPPAELNAMRAVKAHLDPDWLLGQGNIFLR